MSGTDLPVETMVTTYTVCAYPYHDNNRFHFEITVEYRGDNRWAVTRLKQCLGIDGEWDYESTPSERDDQWLTGHRFGLDTALQLAREAAPGLTVNGLSIDDVVRRKNGARP